MDKFNSVAAWRDCAERAQLKSSRLENENQVLRAALWKMATWKSNPGGWTGSSDFDEGCILVRESVRDEATEALDEADSVRNRYDV